MTHSSIVPVTVGETQAYLYAGSGGVAAVAPEDGRLLWDTTDWKINIATVPSPVPLGDGRVFLSGGYDAGSMMIELAEAGEGLTHRSLFRLDAEVFGAAQQTPVYHEGHIFGVRPDGQLVCLTPEGRTRWASGAQHKYGLGPFMIADGLIFVMDDHGHLSVVEAVPDRFNLLAQAQVLDGHDSWGPMALAGGRLILRDLTRMVCLDVRAAG
jgi:outer membrane protein assembly factor BamB